MSDERSVPGRLVDASGPSGELLRQALADREQDRALPRFVALRERRARRLRSYRIAGAVTAAGVTLLALLALRTVPSASEAPAIVAEQFVIRSGHEPSPAASAVAEPHTASSPLASVPAAAGAPAVDRPKQRAASATRLPLEPPNAAVGEAVPSVAETAALGSAKTCAEIARSGAAEEAIACYARLAGGSGVSAELALFEQARLAGKVLHQPERALRTLANYRERFPQGALRAEVMLAQIDWLVTSGQSARALVLVEEALRSGLLQERATELGQLRDRLEREATTLRQR